MTDRNLTAMYDTQGAAESARDHLVGIGLAHDAISIHGTDSGAPTPADTAGEEQGFWASLANLFMPDEDRHTYAEGLRRGSYMLSARVPDGLEEAAAHVLEGSEPIDLDERSSSWRQDGWAGYDGGASSYAGAPAAAAYSEGAGLAEADPASAPLGASVSPRQEQVHGESEGKAFAFVDNDNGDEVAKEQLRLAKREIGRGSVRVRSYVSERPVEQPVEDDRAPRKPTGTGTVVEGSVVDPDLAGTNR